MEKDIALVIEKYRTKYRDSFPYCDTEDPPYTFIEAIMTMLGVSDKTAIYLNWLGNKYAGRLSPTDNLSEK